MIMITYYLANFTPVRLIMALLSPITHQLCTPVIIIVCFIWSLIASATEHEPCISVLVHFLKCIYVFIKKSVWSYKKALAARKLLVSLYILHSSTSTALACGLWEGERERESEGKRMCVCACVCYACGRSQTSSALEKTSGPISISLFWCFYPSVIGSHSWQPKQTGFARASSVLLGPLQGTRFNKTLHLSPLGLAAVLCASPLHSCAHRPGCSLEL